MEQVDKDTNVRSKAVYDKWGNVFDARADIEDEPQTCGNCKWSQTICRLGANLPCHSYEPKTEPQTDCAWGKGEE